MSASNHEFNEREADAILKRAIELQSSQDLSKAGSELSGGLTLEQLYRSAAEIGIDASLVRKAAEEVAGQKIVPVKSDPRAPVLIEREFLTPITEADFPALLEHLRAVTKSSGAAQVIGGTLEWNTMVMINREMIHVVVIPSAESTTIRIRSTNPFAQVPTRTPFFVLPFVILAMGFIPLLSFGGKYFTWVELIPFIVIAAFACLIPLVFFGRLHSRRGDSSRGSQLMASIGEWLLTRKG